MKILLTTIALIVAVYFPKLSGPDGCKKNPNFVSKLGFNSKAVAYSTSESKRIGIVILDMTTGKSYQNKSWKKAGSLGPVEVDENGNAYTIPIPTINILNNKPSDQNKIYRIDTNTAEMEEIMNIPFTKTKYEENPFGMLGLAYDCDTKILYASSIAGSTRDAEKGKIYAINKEQKVVIDSLENIDVMGMEVAMQGNIRTLFYGSTRTSQIYTIKLGENGMFVGKPVVMTSLSELGPRGDDRARKIRFVNDKMVVYGVEFYYNLIAPTEKQETIYNFKWKNSTQKWVFDSYSN